VLMPITRRAPSSAKSYSHDLDDHRGLVRQDRS
jgi:hypothetical protein